MRIDLHAHTDRSDGTVSPRGLVEAAVAAGLDVVAITDHDTTSGWDEAAEAASRAGVRLVRGIELSTRHRGGSVHLLAYEPDPTHPALVAELARIVEGREHRVPAMLDRLRERGFDLSVADVRRQAGDGGVLGRPHVAAALVEDPRTDVQSIDQAFDSWLNTGRPGHVHRYATSLGDAVALVRAAGGVPVLAHPWSRGNERLVGPGVVADLAAQGLAGLEVDHADHDPATRERLRALAADLGLAVTGSSDFHGTRKTGHELGSETTAPGQLERLLGDRW